MKVKISIWGGTKGIWEGGWKGKDRNKGKNVFNMYTFVKPMEHSTFYNAHKQRHSRALWFYQEFSGGSLEKNVTRF